MSDIFKHASDWGRHHLAEFDEGTIEIKFNGATGLIIIGYAKVKADATLTHEYYVCLQAHVNQWSANRHLFNTGDYELKLSTSGVDDWASGLTPSAFKTKAEAHLGGTGPFEYRHQKVTFTNSF